MSKTCPKFTTFGAMKKPKGTILFVHGVCHASWCWEEFFVPFFEKRGYTCRAISLTGHEPGRREPIHHLRLSRYIQDVEEAIRQSGAPPIIIGHSMGGMIVQHYLKKGHSGKVILMSSIPPRGAFLSSLRVIAKYPIALKYLAKMDLLGLFLAKDELMFGTDMPRGKREAYKKQMCAESFRAYLQLLLPARLKKKFPDQMLVIGGDQDRIFTTREFEQTARKYEADLDLIEGGAHDLMLDRRKKPVAEAMLRWLEK